MREFFDTSVLIAAFHGGHVHHLPSLKRFAAAEKKHSACGIHSLAEVYAVMTVLPVKPMIPPEQALLFVEEIRSRLESQALPIPRPRHRPPHPDTLTRARPSCIGRLAHLTAGFAQLVATKMIAD